MRAVVDADPAVELDARRIHDTLAELAVHVGERPQPGRVQVASPMDVRARRYEAVFICGLQESEFPAGGSPDAFLPDADRRELARASGLVLPLREDRLDRERYLFYVCASRAERRLVLSTRTSDEEGNPAARSFFVDDVLAVFGGKLPERARSLADVTWKLEEAPTEAEWERAVAHTGPRRRDTVVGPLALPAAVEPLAARDAVSAYALERFASCPVVMAGGRGPGPREAGARPRGHGPRLLRAQGAGDHLPRAARADGRPPRHGGQPARGRAPAAGGHGGPARRVPPVARPDARAGGRAAAGVRPAALPAPRGRPRRVVRARVPGAALRLRGLRPRGGRAGGRHQGARCDRPRGHLGRLGAGARLQERQGRQVQALGLAQGEPLPGGPLHAGGRPRAGPEAGGRGVRAAAGHRPPRAGHGGRGAGRRAGQRLRGPRPGARGPVRRVDRLGGGVRSARWPRACAPATWSRARTPAPGAAAARTPRSAGWRRDAS